MEETEEGKEFKGIDGMVRIDNIVQDLLACDSPPLDDSCLIYLT